MAHAKVETLRAVLKESKQVKSKLEKKLDEQRKKRREKELELSSVNGKLAQMKDMFVKIREAKDMMHHKTELSQMQANRILMMRLALDALGLDSIEVVEGLEMEIKRKRELLKKIDEDITKYNENRNTEVETFEKDLSALSKQFLAAKQEYSNNVLAEKIKEAEISHEHILPKAKTAAEEELNTANFMKSLQMEQTIETDNSDDVDKENIWKCMTAEKETLGKRLQITMEEMESTRNK